MTLAPRQALAAPTNAAYQRGNSSKNAMKPCLYFDYYYRPKGLLYAGPAPREKAAREASISAECAIIPSNLGRRDIILTHGRRLFRRYSLGTSGIYISNDNSISRRHDVSSARDISRREASQ